jgi:hypothetical protein
MDEQISEISNFLARMRDAAEDVLKRRHPECAVAKSPPTEESAKASPSAAPGFLTVEECAALLRTTPKAIYNRHSRGLLKGAVKDGDRLLVRRDALLESLTEARVSSPERNRR